MFILSYTYSSIIMQLLLSDEWFQEGEGMSIVEGLDKF